MFLVMALVIATVSIPEGMAQIGNETIISSKILPDSLKANINSIWIDGNGDILLATAHLGLLRSTDNGGVWKGIFNVPDFLAHFSFAVIRDPKTNAILLGTANGIFRSIDNGLSWVSVFQIGGPYVRCFFAKDNVILAGVTKGIVQSSDGGQTWKVIFSDSTSYFEVKSITFNKWTSTFLAGIADTTSYGVIRSTDDGKTWQKANNGLGDLHVLSVASDDSGVLYAGTEKKGLYCSSDNGNSWTKVVGINGAKKEAREILVVRSDLIFVGFGWDGIGDGGVFKYDGKSWTQIVPDSVYSIMSLAVKGKSLLVGTSSSLYRVDGVIDTPVGVEETPSVPSSFRLEQNYPNPFNPSTVIRYSVPKTGLVNISVFNLLSQEVKILVNEVKSAGAHEVSFNASNLSSGIYLYRLQSGKFTETKRMVLVK